MVGGNNSINKGGLSFWDKFNPFLENKEELKNQIKKSDTLPGSKEFLIKQLEKYSNNDNNIKESDLNSKEIAKIKKLIKRYDILENKYKLFREKLKNNYSNLIKVNKSQGYFQREYGDGDGDIITDVVHTEEIVEIKENKYTLEVENYLNNIDIGKLNSVNIEEYLNKKEDYIKKINSIIGNITKNISYINSVPNYHILENLYIKLAEEYINNIEKYEAIKGDYKLINKLLENIEISNDQIKEFGDLGIIIKENEENKKILFLKQKLKKYEKYSDKLKNEGLSEETKETIFLGINNFLKNKSVYIDGKNIKFTEEYINKNKSKFIENIKQYLIVLMNIESYGGKNVENKNSSAKGPLQWIDGWKNGKKHSSFNRKEGKTTPFETALRRANKFYTGEKYPTFKSNKLPTHIKEAWNNGGKLILNKFDTEKQIQLWYIDNIMREGKAQELLMGIMVGNKWSAIKLYEDIHHTNSTKGTETRKVVVNNFKYIALK